MSTNKDKLDFMDKCLSRVIDWLKFAEAKNAAIVAVGSAFIFGAFRIANSIDCINQYQAIYFISFFLLTIIAILISLLSFIPRLQPPFWIKMDKINANDNPLFFGHAYKYSKTTYLDLFNDKYDSSGENGGGFEIELSDQIVNNSRIAFIKYKMCNSAIWLLIGAILTPVGALLVYIVKR